MFNMNKKQNKSKKAQEEQKIKIHERCLGKRFFVLTNGGWYGYVRSIIDVEHFGIENKDGKIIPVNIFDVRDQDYFD